MHVQYECSSQRECNREIEYRFVSWNDTWGKKNEKEET